jgi:hypothetical protein
LRNLTEDGERDFSIELDSNQQLTRLQTSNAERSGVLIEGTLGKLVHARFVEPEILEVKGTCGVLRINLRVNEITVKDSQNKSFGGEKE